jgi:hypothetical protein|tara:strand:- start:7117 stop:7356 length:240 start_codon:yes stop_codon:yes gene_type:complete
MPREKYDQEILDEAMRNAYAILTGKFTFENLMDLADEVALPFNIEKEKPDYDAMIEYFIETEEYEKCAKLVKLKNESET